ncbi:ferrous iron transport protein A [Lutibacter aestuarii]|uniref:Ferrous iron transport protein A n=1 Tax=Lutibacter aestuarii TaxID=861111 RepID=A0ABW2Z7L5_9FLAO|nr:FeoA family protein [uncultured Lutibacter sp.]
MGDTIGSLRIGEVGVIEDFCLDVIPLNLLEMGCLPGKKVKLLQVAPLKDPLYIKVNGSHLAIRKDMANLINITKL